MGFQRGETFKEKYPVVKGMSHKSQNLRCFGKILSAYVSSVHDEKIVVGGETQFEDFFEWLHFATYFTGEKPISSANCPY